MTFRSNAHISPSQPFYATVHDQKISPYFSPVSLTSGVSVVVQGMDYNILDVCAVMLQASRFEREPLFLRDGSFLREPLFLQDRPVTSRY